MKKRGLLNVEYSWVSCVRKKQNKTFSFSTQSKTLFEAIPIDGSKDKNC